MVDMPQVPPPAYEQVVTHKLLQCGLRNGGFTVKYEEELQSVEIVIDREAGATSEQIECIRQATGNYVVTFKDPELQKAYLDRVFDAFRPKMLADARADLEKRGVFDGFPERSAYASEMLFGVALERQCGLKPGSFFVQSQSGLVVQPKLGRQNKTEEDRMACMMTAIMYVTAKGEDFTFGFVGNEAVAPGN